MKAAEIRELETDELHGRIGELKEELFNLRFQLATGQLDNHRRMQIVKRDIARIRTVLRERDFATAAQMASEGARPVAVAPAAATVPAAPSEASEPNAEAEES